GTGDVVVRQPDQRAIPVDRGEAATAQTVFDQAVRQSDPVEIFECSGLDSGRFGTGGHCGFGIDDDVVDAQPGEGDGQGQTSWTAAHDQHIGVSRQVVGHLRSLLVNPYQTKTIVSFY